MEPYLSTQALNWSFSGEFRRKLEVITVIEVVATIGFFEILKKDLLENPLIDPTSEDTNGDAYGIKTINGIPLKIIACTENEFAFKLWQTTGTTEHINQASKANNVLLSALENCKSEDEIYKKLKLPFIQPELREGIFEIDLALKNQLPELVELSDLKGILHNHSTDSDGINTLEEMAVYCKNMGMEYLGICDHSKSAFYANGLSIERVLDQHKRIDALNLKLAPFKIFKGIESDILADGSLDYPAEILAQFDFIVGSIHSGLQMDEEKATQRLINAIKNPYCTLLGHPTGRLLLARKGYPINHKAVIDACAENGVVIELNAHPYRLDLDWRWIQYALSKNVMISINPDAHATSGYHDMHFGICSARKGGLFKEMTFNAKTLEEITTYFNFRKSSILKSI
jgi:DNA polymerase (family 10)